MKMQYAVLRFGNAWRIVSGGGRTGRFPDRAGAERIAAGLAREASAMGYDVDLLVQTPSGELRGVDVPHTIH
jgi:hypothetical protein